MSNIWCFMLGHKLDNGGVCRRCGDHENVGYQNPFDVRCPCPKCPGALKYDGFNRTRAFLVCSSCKCCYVARNSEEIKRLQSVNE